jgi:hypothetical protein
MQMHCAHKYLEMYNLDRMNEKVAEDQSVMGGGQSLTRDMQL